MIIQRNTQDFNSEPDDAEIEAILRREYEAEADCGQRVYDLTHTGDYEHPASCRCQLCKYEREG